jgi:hypothetical protein
MKTRSEYLDLRRRYQPKNVKLVIIAVPLPAAVLPLLPKVDQGTALRPEQTQRPFGCGFETTQSVLR